MNELNAFYSQFLELGFIVLKQAMRERNYDWAEVEIQLLHNVPSLLDEPNIHRHRYFWFQEREEYLTWVNLPGREHPKSRMLTFYQPLWREMEPVMLSFLSSDSGYSGCL